MSEIPHILCTTAYVQALEEFSNQRMREKFDVHFFSMDDRIANLIQMAFLTPLPWVRYWTGEKDEDCEFTIYVSDTLEVNVQSRDVLTLQTGDGLVVRDDKSLSMSGCFSKKVLERTYPNYKTSRERVKNKYHIDCGVVVPLEYSGKDKWKKLYHIILPSNNTDFVQLYKTCMEGVLEIADQESHKTRSIGMKIFVGKILYKVFNLLSTDNHHSPPSVHAWKNIFWSSPKLKAQVRFSDCLLSVICLLDLFIFDFLRL
jgi:hypothetical protein